MRNEDEAREEPKEDQADDLELEDKAAENVRGGATGSKLDGIQGEATETKHTDWIEIL